MVIKLNKISSVYAIDAVNRQGRQRSQQERPGDRQDVRQVQDRVSLSNAAQKKQNGIKTEENLTTEEKQQVNDLRKRDAEVKAHEQAHMAAGGGIVQGGASYQYQVGPDGKRYAVGGEVSIDVSPERTPEGTIRKMQQVKSAALAPAQPSGTDRAVAARAAQMEAKARSEKIEQEQKAREGKNEDDPMASPIEASPVDSIPEKEMNEDTPSALSGNAVSGNTAPAFYTPENPLENKGSRVNLVI